MHAHKDNGGRGKPRAKGVVVRHGNRVAPSAIQNELKVKATAKRERRAARRRRT